MKIQKPQHNSCGATEGKNTFYYDFIIFLLEGLYTRSLKFWDNINFSETNWKL